MRDVFGKWPGKGWMGQMGFMEDGGEYAKRLPGRVDGLALSYLVI